MADQLKLGELIALLEKCEPKTKVSFDFVYFVPDCSIHSWRGSYDELALGYGPSSLRDGDDPTVEKMLDILKGAVGKEFYGWKGGEYTMHLDTPLWVGNPRDAGHTAIVGVKDEKWNVFILTEHHEW